MTIAGIFKQVLDGLWLVGGIGAAADLGMDDFGPGADELRPNSNCANQEAAPCRACCSISSPTPPSR